MGFVAQDMSVSTLLERVGSRDIRLPEIQRDYVWKSSQIAWLLDSLYRGYPSGTLLLWESDEEVAEKNVSSDVAGVSVTRPQYLLDGQQRLTSLHRVFTGHDKARVVFNVVSEKFQLESVATKKDSRWVAVQKLLRGEFKAAEKRALRAAHPGLDEDELDDRISRVGKIRDYNYRVEILQHMTYTEVTEIFVRVNSRGKALTRGDLALATLTAKYPGFYDKIKSRADTNAQLGYRQLGIGTLTRALALYGTSSGSLAGIASASNADIDAGWNIVVKGTEHLLSLLRNNLDMGTDTLLPSINALVPLIGYLGTRDDKAPMTQKDANALIYWLLVASLTSRYTGPIDTLFGQDKKAIADKGIHGLYDNLGLAGRYHITADYLVGRSLTSSAFMLSFLAARAQGATDWWTATRIGLDGSGHFRIEYHHIHPQATLKKTHTKAQINDLANLAFISEAANKRISARPPSVYFGELDEAELSRHFIPLDEPLRETSNYLAFIAARRSALAAAINGFLDSWVPDFLADEGTNGEQGATRVSLQLFADHEPEHGTLRMAVETAEGSWAADMPVASLLRALNDAEDNIATQVDLPSGESVPVAETEDGISIELGPVRLDGALQEWRAMLDREFADVLPLHELGVPQGWPEPALAPIDFPVRECD
jgi:hypothetical protein